MPVASGEKRRCSGWETGSACGVARNENTFYGGAATALLFVNHATTGRGSEQPRADLNRVVVTLHRGEGDWVVTDLDAL